jgi:hypothetical protein
MYLFLLLPEPKGKFTFLGRHGLYLGIISSYLNLQFLPARAAGHAPVDELEYYNFCASGGFALAYYVLHARLVYKGPVTRVRPM